MSNIKTSNSFCLVSDLDPAVRSALEKIRLLAEQYESGAASSPYSDRCRILFDPTIAKILTITLVSICDASRQTALYTLLEKDLADHVLRLTNAGFDSLNLYIQEQGFFIENGNQKQIFDSKNDLFENLQKIQPSAGENLSSLNIGIHLPLWPNGTRLIVTGNFEQLIRSNNLMLKLSNESDVILLAGTDDNLALNNEEEIGQLLCHNAPISQALIISKSPSAALSNPDWLKILQSSIISNPSRATLTEDGGFSIAQEYPLLIDNLARLYLNLSNHRVAREVKSIAATLNQQIRAENDRMTERRRMNEIPASNTNDPGYRNIIDQVNTSLQSDVVSLMRHIEDETRDSLLPGGKLFQLVKKVSEGLEAKQLTRTLLPKSARLEAGEDLCSSLRNKILGELVSDMDKQTAFLAEAISASADVIAIKLEETTGHPVEIKLPQPQSNRFHHFASSLASAPLLLRSEVPRTTATQFAWTCFQNPTMILMSLTMPMSMFLSSPDAGPILRKFKFDIALYGLVPIFLITPFYLHRKIRREAELNLEREMERLRNSLQTDLERMARTISDERRKIAGDWIKSSFDDIRKTAVAILGDFSKHEDKRRAEEKQSQSANIQRLDVRLREMNQSAQQCDQIDRDVRQVLNTITSTLATAART